MPQPMLLGRTCAWLAMLLTVGCARSALDTDVGYETVPVEDDTDAGSGDAGSDDAGSGDAGMEPEPAPRMGQGCMDTLLCMVSCLGLDLGGLDALVGGGGISIPGLDFLGGGMSTEDQQSMQAPLPPVDTSNIFTCIPECLGRACEASIPLFVDSVGCVIGSSLEGILEGEDDGAGDFNPLDLIGQCGTDLFACVPHSCDEPPINDLQGGVIGAFLDGVFGPFLIPDEEGDPSSDMGIFEGLFSEMEYTDLSDYED